MLGIARLVAGDKKPRKRSLYQLGVREEPGARPEH